LENDEAVIFGKLIITKEGSPGMAILAIPILRTKQALNLDSQIAGAKTLVKKKLEIQFLSANLYHTGTEGMGWHSDAEKNLKKWSYRLCKFWCRTKIPSNTETARKRYHRTYPRQLVSDEDRPKLTGSTAHLPLHALLLLE
jgi:hypothetical protein